MKEIPKLLKYTVTHEWVKPEGNNIFTIGITHHAQDALGDIVFVELPVLKKTVKKGEETCVLESVKTAADVYAPLAGEIIETNTALNDTPELVNSDSYGEGWLFRIKITTTNELEGLLTAENYEEQISVEVH